MDSHEITIIEDSEQEELQSSQEEEEEEEEEQVPSPEVEKPDRDKAHLEEIQNQLKLVLKSHEDLEALKQQLDILIDSMSLNPSILSRTARYWGELPQWQKLAIGTVLVIPTFLLGVIANVTAIIASSLIILVVYTAASLLLDEHQRSYVDGTDNLKNGVHALAEALGAIILSLNSLREHLALDIQQLQEKIEQLSEVAFELENHVQTLSTENKTLHETGTQLQATGLKLKQEVATLQSALEEQKDLLSQSKANVETLTDSLEKQKQLLTQTQTNVDTLTNSLEEQRQLQTQTQAHVTTLTASLEEQRQLQTQTQDNVTTLTASLEKQKELQEQTQQTLEKNQSDFEQNRLQLSGEISRLETANKELSANLKDSVVITESLRGTVNSFAEARIKGTKDWEVFQGKLDAFLKNEKATILDITKRIHESEEKLAAVSAELQKSLDRHEQLLTKHEDLLRRQEKTELKYGPALKKHGFHPAEKEQREDPNHINAEAATP